MNNINRNEITTHLNLLGWLYIAVHVFFLLLAAFGFFLFPIIAVITHNADVTMVLSVLGTAFGILMVLLALPGLVADYGLLRHKQMGTPVEYGHRRIQSSKFPFWNRDWSLCAICAVSTGSD